VKGRTEIPPAPVYLGIGRGGERPMEGILLGSGAFSTTMPITLGLIVLVCWGIGVYLGHAADEEKSERPGEEKENIRKAA
jgi:hypothetical protein